MKPDWHVKWPNVGVFALTLVGALAIGAWNGAAVVALIGYGLGVAPCWFIVQMGWLDE